MTKYLLLVGASALALTSGTASANGLRPALGFKHEPIFRVILPHRGATVLYDQSEGDVDFGVLSQHFLDPGFSIYDSQGADDFILPAGRHTIKEVVANGFYYNGAGPADSFNVFFYKGSTRSTCCETLIEVCPNQPYTDISGTGFVDIPLLGCTGSRYAKFKGGRRYFISVQANMAFESGGEWGWNTNSIVRGKPSFWENPRDGLSTGCVTYTRTTKCFSLGEGGDFAFALRENRRQFHLRVDRRAVQVGLRFCGTSDRVHVISVTCAQIRSWKRARGAQNATLAVAGH